MKYLLYYVYWNGIPLNSLCKLQWCRVIWNEKVHNIKIYTRTWCSFTISTTCWLLAHVDTGLVLHADFRKPLVTNSSKAIYFRNHCENCSIFGTLRIRWKWQLFSQNWATWVPEQVENGHTEQHSAPFHLISILATPTCEYVLWPGRQRFGFCKGDLSTFVYDRTKKFAETQLSPIKAFYNTIKDEPCPLTNYDRAREIRAYCDKKTVKNYHYYYLLSDVLL